MRKLIFIVSIIILILIYVALSLIKIQREEAFIIKDARLKYKYISKQKANNKDISRLLPILGHEVERGNTYVIHYRKEKYPLLCENILFSLTDCKTVERISIEIPKSNILPAQKTIMELGKNYDMYYSSGNIGFYKDNCFGYAGGGQIQVHLKEPDAYIIHIKARFNLESFDENKKCDDNYVNREFQFIKKVNITEIDIISLKELESEIKPVLANNKP